MTGVQTCALPILSLDELLQLAGRIGADVPFCVCGGCCLGEGRGERLTPLPFLTQELVVAKPLQSTSTAQAFAAYDCWENPEHPATQEVLYYLKAGEKDRVWPLLKNALEQPCLLPESRALLLALREQGAKAALMTGSGSAVFGVFENGEAGRVEQKLQSAFPKAFVKAAQLQKNGVSFA